MGRMRICSFLPSATEILFALGLESEVAGVTYECDYPAAARQRPVVVHTRLPADLTSGEIDRTVRAYVARGESLYRVDLDQLRRIQPDLIITQDLCHVCAASPGDLPEALAALSRPPQILSLTPSTLGDVFEDIRRVGEAAGRRAAAEELGRGLRARLARIEQVLAGVRARPRVLCLEWLDPPYCGGHWVPEMVARAGGEDVLGRVGEASRRLTWEEIRAAAPDVVVVMPCGMDAASAARDYQSVREQPAWRALGDRCRGKLFAVDASSYFSRPGPRLVGGVEILAGLLHPDRWQASPPPGSVLPLA